MTDAVPTDPLQTALDHHRAGRLAEAEAIYRELLSRDPRNSDATYFLALLAEQTGHRDAALSLFHRAGQLAPHRAELQQEIAVAQQRLGQLDAAIASYRRLLALNPNLPHAWHNLAVAFRLLSQGVQAIEAAKRAVALAPDVAAIHDNLGASLLLCGRPQEALAPLARAIELEPTRADAHFHLANALYLLGRCEEAIGEYGRAIELNPEHGDAISNLGSVLHLAGRASEALELDRRAIPLSAEPVRAHSRMLFTLNFVPGIDRAEVFQAHREWGERYADKPASAASSLQWQSLDAPDALTRPLRIGYVSPDFVQHAVSMFFEPLLAAHDRENFEIICYSNTLRTDAYTEHFRALAHGWRDITTMDDNAAVAQILADRIDFLVDLAGHTDRNRLPLFALRPAPVQMTYLGYPNTTGTTAIDYRITDAIADPPGDADALHTERLIRLDRTAWCYRAPEQAPAVAPPPSDAGGAVTFGSFNNLPKLNSPLLALWARLLESVPQSRLLVKAMDLKEPTWRQRLLDSFVSLGLAAERVEVVPPTPTTEAHFAAYARIDIALDTLPYNGTTTTCDALWMGVPVVTLRGDRHVSRVSASLLTAIGLAELIGESEQDYIDRAAKLAHDSVRRRELRKTLRDRMKASPLMNARDLAAAVEKAYRDAWQTRVAAHKGLPRAHDGTRREPN